MQNSNKQMTEIISNVATGIFIAGSIVTILNSLSFYLSALNATEKKEQNYETCTEENKHDNAQENSKTDKQEDHRENKKEYKHESENQKESKKGSTQDEENYTQYEENNTQDEENYTEDNNQRQEQQEKILEINKKLKDISEQELLRQLQENEEYDFLYIRNNVIPDQFCKIFGNMKATSLPYHIQTEYIDANSMISDTVKYMHHKNTSCVTVKDNGKIMGLFTMSDFCALILKNDEWILKSLKNSFSNFTFVKPNTKISEVIAHLKRGLRYIGVNDAESNKCGIISQGTILRYIFSNHNKIDLSKKLIDCNLPSVYQTIISANKEDTIESILYKFIDFNITSLPLINDDGTIAAIISQSDLRYYYAVENVNILQMHAIKFLSLIKPSNLNNIYTCEDADSFFDVLQLMIDKNIHHLYKIDSNSKPVGIVSFVDLLRVM